MKYKKEKTKTKLQKAFTLLELLLVIAIVASLAGLVLVALNPAGRLEDVSDTKALSSANDLEKAIKVYSIDNSGNLPSALQAITTSGIYDICKSGQTIGCINLDELVTGGKLSSIPEDSRYSSTYKSGYKLDFNPSKSESKVYSQSEYDQATKYCPPGDSCLAPIAEWLFDEGTGTTAQDTSGYANNGTLTNGPTWSSGVSNGSLNLDGTNDFISVPDSTALNLTGDLTISLWVKPSVIDSTARLIIGKGNASVPTTRQYSIRLNTSNQWQVFAYSGSNVYSTADTITVPSITRWDHITMVRESNTLKIYTNGIQTGSSTSVTGALNTTNNILAIGREGSTASNYFGGQIDNLRIYNYARTPGQIAWEYNRGGPVAYYKFDECQGTAATNSAIDINGNVFANNGAITIGATGTNTAAGTCSGSAGQAWKDGATGRYSASLEFDGTDDKVVVADANSLDMTDTFTLAAWIKQSGTGRKIITKGVSAGTTGAYIFDMDTSYRLRCYVENVGFVVNGTTALNDNQWHHVACSRNSNNAWSLYIDGQLHVTSTSAIKPTANTVELGIGSHPDAGGGSFTGQIDEVKVYNYALTASQIMQSMHEK